MVGGKKTLKNYEPVVNTWFLKGGGSLDNGITKSGNGIMVYKSIASVGYSTSGATDIENKEMSSDLGKYKEWYESKVPSKTWNQMPQAQLYKLKKGDFIWTRVLNTKYEKEGIKNGYYVARLPKDAEDLYYFHRLDDESHTDLQKTDCLVGLKDIDWEGPFSEDEIPGSISRYIMGKTIVKVDKDEATMEAENVDDILKNTPNKKWSMTSVVSYFLLNEKEKSTPEISFKKFERTPENELSLFKLVGWRGLEDITALWLQQESRDIKNEKKGYYLQPSTCKSGTPAYEYVLIDSDSGKKVFVQTKNSEKKNLSAKDYQNYLIGEDDEFYLVTLGKVDENGKKIEILHKPPKEHEFRDFNEVVKFVFNKDNDKILPLHIKLCRDYLFK